MVSLDPKTRQAIPGANALFLDPKYAMSGSFNGVHTGELQKIHINPNPAVKLAQDKGRMFQQLGRQGMPLGKHKPVENFIRHGAFDLPAFEDFFGLNEKPAQIVSHAGHKELQELEEILAFLEQLEKHAGAVGRQTQLEDPLTAFIRTIPTMDGRELNLGNRTTKNGVLAHNVPTSNPKQAELMASAREATKKVGLDYATVFLQFDNKGDFEILDIVTDLKREDAIALRAFADILYDESRKTTKKHKL